MYRGKLWNIRQIIGLSTPKRQNERLKFAISQGANAVDCEMDTPTWYGIEPDQPYADLPISDEMIDDWKGVASSSQIITSPCPYEISEDTTLGPAKIECDLEISQDPVITLAGNVWVAGNILIKNSAVIRSSPSLGKKSVAIIADNLANRLTSSKITLNNSATFYGSGSQGSYVLLISQNNSAENGGVENAVSIAQTVSGDLLLYAGHGKIFLNNSSDLREVTGYSLDLRNQANVIYETGLANLLFSSGPGGSFSIVSWNEVE